MAPDLKGTNPVHDAVLGKARGGTEFCGDEAAVLVVVLFFLWFGVNALIGLGGVAVTAVLLHMMRRRDNGRREHLALRLRNLARHRRYRCVEPDNAWVPLRGQRQRHH